MTNFRFIYYYSLSYLSYARVWLDIGFYEGGRQYQQLRVVNRKRLYIHHVFEGPPPLSACNSENEMLLTRLELQGCLGA